MKKGFALILTLLLIIGTAGCGAKAFEGPISSLYHTGESGIKTALDLSETEQREILSILNNGNWGSDIPNCLPDYTLTIQNQTVYYHAECGTFSDTAAERSLSLSEDDRIRVNKALDIAEDFSFSLTWNCYGVSSYDSKTGKLVKTTDAPNPEDYVTTYTLTSEDQAFFQTLINTLDVDSYPDVYDPKNGSSRPSMTLILTVRAGDTVKTIAAEDIGLSYKSDDPKGQAFLFTCESIIDRLTATEEWKALPDYAVYYE